MNCCYQREKHIAKSSPGEALARWVDSSSPSPSGWVVGGPGEFPQRLEAPQLTASWAVAPGGRAQPGHRHPPPPCSNMWGAATPPPRNSRRLEFLVDVHLALRRCWITLGKDSSSVELGSSWHFHPTRCAPALHTCTHTHTPLDLPRLRSVLAAHSGAEHRSRVQKRGSQLCWPRE